MLSERDRRQLEEIEARLRAEDPAFAAQMRAPRRPRRAALLLVFVIAWWTVAMPVLAARWSLIGALMLAAVLTAVAALYWWLPRHRARRTGSSS